VTNPLTKPPLTQRFQLGGVSSRWKILVTGGACVLIVLGTFFGISVFYSPVEVLVRFVFGLFGLEVLFVGGSAFLGLLMLFLLLCFWAFSVSFSSVIWCWVYVCLWWFVASGADQDVGFKWVSSPPLCVLTSFSLILGHCLYFYIHLFFLL